MDNPVTMTLYRYLDKVKLPLRLHNGFFGNDRCAQVIAYEIKWNSLTNKEYFRYELKTPAGYVVFVDEEDLLNA